MILIDKDKLLEAIDEIPCGECDGHGLDECYACVVGRVRTAPVVVDLVQCKDCKHSYMGYDRNNVKKRYCVWWNDHRTNDFGFCHMAERKEVKDDA